MSGFSNFRHLIPGNCKVETEIGERSPREAIDLTEGEEQPNQTGYYRGKSAMHGKERGWDHTRSNGGARGEQPKQQRGLAFAPQDPTSYGSTSSYPASKPVQAYVEVPTSMTSHSTRKAALGTAGSSVYKKTSGGSGVSSPYAPGIDNLGDGFGRPAPAPAQDHGQPSRIRPRPSFQTQLPGTSSLPAPGTTSHYFPQGDYSHQQARPSTSASSGDPRLTKNQGMNGYSQPSSISRVNNAQKMSIKGNAERQKAEKQKADKGKGRALPEKGNARPPQQVIELDSDDDEHDGKKGMGDDEIENSDEERQRPGPSNRPASTTSAQKTIPAGNTKKLQQSIESRGNQVHAKPAQADGGGSEDEMQFKGTGTGAGQKPKQVAAMTSKKDAPTSGGTSTLATKPNTLKNRASTAPNVILCIPILFCVCDSRYYRGQSLELLYAVQARHFTLRNNGKTVFEFPMTSIVQLQLPDGKAKKDNAFMLIDVVEKSKGTKSQSDTVVEHRINFYRTHDDFAMSGWPQLYESMSQMRSKHPDQGGLQVGYLSSAAFHSICDDAKSRATKAPPEKTLAANARSAPGEAAMRREKEARRAEAEQKRAEREAQQPKSYETLSLSGDELDDEAIVLASTTRPRPRPSAREKKSLSVEPQPSRGGPSKPFDRTKKKKPGEEEDDEADIVVTVPSTKRTTYQSNQSKRSRDDSRSSSPPDIKEAFGPTLRRRSPLGKGKGRAETSDDDEDIAAQIAAADWERWEPEDEVALVYPRNATGSVTITNADMNRLAPLQYLNDTLVEYGMRRVWDNLREREKAIPEGQSRLSDQIHIFSSFFYKKLSTKDRKTKIDPYLTVKKWTNKFNIFEKKYIILPINENFHWYLAIIVNPGWVVDPRAAKNKPAPPAARKNTRKSGGGDAGKPIPADAFHSASGKQKGKPRIAQSDDEEDDAVPRDKPSEEFPEASDVPAPLPPSRDPSESVEMLGEAASRKTPTREHSTSSSSTSMITAPDKSATTIEPEEPVKDTSGNAKELEDNIMQEASEMPSAEEAATRLAEAAADVTSFANEQSYILTLDSLGGTHPTVYSNLKNYLKNEAQDKLKLTEEQIYINKENCRGTYARVPHQHNFSDCGLYVMHFAEIFLKEASTVLSYVGTDKKPSQTEEAIDLLWDLAGATARRDALFEELKVESADWKEWRKREDLAILEAKRKAKEAKAAHLQAAQATDTGGREAAKESTEEQKEEVDQLASSSEEEEESEVIITGVKIPSPLKKSRRQRGGATSKKSDVVPDGDTESQDIVEVASSRTQHAKKMEAGLQSNMPTHPPESLPHDSPKRSGSPGKRQPTEVEVVVPTSPSKVAQAQVASANASKAGPEASDPPPRKRKKRTISQDPPPPPEEQMDVDSSPEPPDPPSSLESATAKIVASSPSKAIPSSQQRSGHQQAADAYTVNSSDEDSDGSEKTDSEKSEFGVEVAVVRQAERDINEAASGVDNMAVSRSHSPKSGLSSFHLPSNSRHTSTNGKSPVSANPQVSGSRNTGADDSFQFVPVGPAAEAAGNRRVPSTDDLDILSLVKADLGVYEQNVRHGEQQPSPVSPTQTGQAAASPIDLDSDEGAVVVASQSSQKGKGKNKVNSPGKQKDGSKRRRQSSTETGAPGASQEQEKRANKKKRTEAAKLGPPTSVESSSRNTSNTSTSYLLPSQDHILIDDDSGDEKKDKSPHKSQQNSPFASQTASVSGSPKGGGVRGVREPAFPPRMQRRVERSHATEQAVATPPTTDHWKGIHTRFTQT